MSQKVIDKVLTMSHWPIKLETNHMYFISHDDTDGDKSEGLTIGISIDGDVWIKAMTKQCEMIRFRMPFGGGGKYPKVRNALLVLAEAIRQEVEDGSTNSSNGT